MFHKTKKTNKKWFCRSCLQCFNCINGKQSVKPEKGIIELENYLKEIPVPFKIYGDFECNLRDVGFYEGSYTKKSRPHSL